MAPEKTRTRRARFIGALVLAVCLTATAAFVLDAPDARADAQEDLATQKEEFQNRYRRLLHDAVVLENNARNSREDYARAQRRNYPRGGARQQLILQAEQAEAELRTVKQEIEALKLDARRQGMPPGWLYEVEGEEVAPAAPSGTTSDENDAEDREGRNPLYLEDDDKT